MYLMGNNFGPASLYLHWSIQWYGTSSDNHETYKISNCEVIISHTKIRCTSLESKNNVNRTSLRWIVKIEDQRSIVSENSETSYGIPEITSLSNHVGLNTSGGEYVYLMGNNNEYVWYGTSDQHQCYQVLVHTMTICMVSGTSSDKS